MSEAGQAQWGLTLLMYGFGSILFVTSILGAVDALVWFTQGREATGTVVDITAGLGRWPVALALGASGRDSLP